MIFERCIIEKNVTGGTVSKIMMPFTEKLAKTNSGHKQTLTATD